jgi:hypothetical protein
MIDVGDGSAPGNAVSMDFHSVPWQMQLGRSVAVKPRVPSWVDRMAIHNYEDKRHMKFNSGIAAAIVLSLAVAGLAACEKKGPAEKAGEKIDNTVKKAGEKIEEAGDKVKDAVKK